MKKKEEKDAEDTELYDFFQLARLLRCTESALRGKIAMGRVPRPFKFPGARRLYWKKADIERWIREAEEGGGKK